MTTDAQARGLVTAVFSGRPMAMAPGLVEGALTQVLGPEAVTAMKHARANMAAAIADTAAAPSTKRAPRRSQITVTKPRSTPAATAKARPRPAARATDDEALYALFTRGRGRSRGR